MTQAANLAALGTNAGTTGILATTGGGTAGTAGVTGFKNRFINGDMRIAQRGVGPNNNTAGAGLGINNIDRWGYWAGPADQFTTQQSTTVPTGAGFTYSALITSLGAATQTSGTYATYSQRIEGYNIADLGWGTANAKTVTVSFWIRSSLTGTFSAYVFNSGYTYCFPFTFSIPTANTWVQITQTITGPTSGTWLTTNGIGLEFGITLLNGTNYQAANATWTTTAYAIGVAGSVNLLGTNGATMYLTGVQLEVGTAATNFDVRSIGTELGLCQRYYEVAYNGTGSDSWYSSSSGGGGQRYWWNFKVEKRSAPSAGLGTGSTWYQATPTAYPSLSACQFYTPSTAFGPLGNNGTVSVYASAEL